MLQDIPLSTGIRLRVAQAKDRAFMEQLFLSTREYLYQIPLPKLQLDTLIGQQYHMQQACYAEQSPHAYTLIIQRADEPIGNITLDETETALHILDLALVPEVRGEGYGTALLHAIQAVARNRSVAIKLSVDRQNPRAQKFYRRLRFQPAGRSDTHEFMVWLPPASDAPQAEHLATAANHF